jgi:hypothetical protein
MKYHFWNHISLDLENLQPKQEKPINQQYSILIEETTFSSSPQADHVGF